MQQDTVHSDMGGIRGWGSIRGWISIWGNVQKAEWCTGCIWTAISCLLQASVYLLMHNFSDARTVARDNKPITKAEFVMVRDIAPPEPESVKTVPEEKIPADESDSFAMNPIKQKATPDTNLKPAPSRHIAKKPGTPETPTKPEEPASPAFRDMGVMGSVDATVVGTGAGSFAVSAENSGVLGAIGTGGKMNGPISMSNLERVFATQEKETALPPKKVPIASIRDLSVSAKPDVAHNRRLKARYPESLRQESIVGEVLAMLVVLPDGTVGKVTVLSSSHDAFAASAREVLKRFRFAPARDKNGKAVGSQIRITYRFTLES